MYLLLQEVLDVNQTISLHLQCQLNISFQTTKAPERSASSAELQRLNLRNLSQPQRGAKITTETYDQHMIN